MPAAIPIAMGVSAVAGIAGSVIQAGAAKSAAQTQVDAAQQAGKQVVDTTAQANPQIGQAAQTASTGVTTASTAAATGATAAANTGTTGVSDASKSANGLLDPYSSLGTQAVNALSLNLNDLTKTPTLQDLQLDPGFAFQLQQGQQALDRSAAARGGALGGGQVKAQTRYAQDYSNTAYTNAWNRYMQSRQQNISTLTGLMNSGQAAAGTEGSNLINTNEFNTNTNTNAAQYAGTVGVSGQEYAGNASMSSADLMAQNTISAAKAQGDYLTQGANAKAAGDVGSANAIAGGLTNAGSSLVNALVLNKVLGKT